MEFSDRSDPDKENRACIFFADAPSPVPKTGVYFPKTPALFLQRTTHGADIRSLSTYAVIFFNKPVEIIWNLSQKRKGRKGTEIACLRDVTVESDSTTLNQVPGHIMYTAGGTGRGNAAVESRNPGSICAQERRWSQHRVSERNPPVLISQCARIRFGLRSGVSRHYQPQRCCFFDTCVTTSYPSV